MPHPPQIPLTPQTDERNFPRWEKDAPFGKSGHAYPKMMTHICTSADRNSWVEKNRRIDQNTRQEYWEETPPRVGTQIPYLATQALVDENLASFIGAPVIAQDKEQEQRILKVMGLAEPEAPPPKPVSIPIQAQQPKRRGRPRKIVQSEPQGEWIQE